MSDKKIRLTPEQREAVDKYQRDFKAAMPHIAELAGSAKAVHQAIIDAPIWHVHEEPKPEGVQDVLKPWTVGHAKVNYVEKIETTVNNEGAEGK